MLPIHFLLPDKPASHSHLLFGENTHENAPFGPQMLWEFTPLRAPQIKPADLQAQWLWTHTSCSKPLVGGYLTRFLDLWVPPFLSW